MENEGRTIEVGQSSSQDEANQQEKLFDLASARRLLHDAEELAGATENHQSFCALALQASKLDKPELVQDYLKRAVDRINNLDARGRANGFVDLAETNLALGSEEGFAENIEQALEVIKRSNVAPLEQSTLYRKIASLYAHNNQREQAILTLDKAADSAVSIYSRDARDQFNEYLKLIEAYIELNAFTSAKELVNRAMGKIGSTEKHSRAYYHELVASLQDKMGDIEGARETRRAGLSEYEHEADERFSAWEIFEGAEARVKVEGEDRALEIFNEAKSRLEGVDNERIYESFVKKFIELGDIESAQEVLTQLENLAINLPEYFQREEDRGSERVFSIYHEVMKLQLLMGQVDAAKATVEKVAPKYSIRMHDFLVHESLRNGYLEPALEAIDKVENLEQKVYSLIKIAEYQAEHGDLDNAKETIDKVESIRDESKEYEGSAVDRNLSIANLELKFNGAGKAKEYIRKAITAHLNDKYIDQSGSTYKEEKIATYLIEVGARDDIPSFLSSVREATLRKESSRWNIEKLIKLAKLQAFYGDNESAYVTLTRARQRLQDKAIHQNEYGNLSRDIVAQEAEIGVQILTGISDLSIELSFLREEVDPKQIRKVAASVGVAGSREDVENLMDSVRPEDQELLQSVVDTEAVRYQSEYGTHARTEIAQRTKELLRRSVEDPLVGSRQLNKYLTQTLYYLDSKEAKDAVLNAARASIDSTELDNLREMQSHLPRILKALAEMNTFRGNDLIVRTAADPELSIHYSRYLFGKLVENGYMDRSVSDWYLKHARRSAEENAPVYFGQKNCIDCIKLLISRTGMMPTEELLNYIVAENWDGSEEEFIQHVESRIEAIKQFQEEFESAEDASALVELLASDKEKAMAYYILNNGKSRFDLINNYSFDKFFEILGIIRDLEIHDAPINEFKESLSRSGLSSEQIAQIETNIRAGRQPFATEGQPYLERDIRLDISDNVRLEGANQEVAQVLGRDQLGVCLKAPLYRDFLATNDSEASRNLLDRLNNSDTLDQRNEVIKDIEEKFPEALSYATQTLAEPWRLLGDKMLFNVTVDNVLNEPANIIDTESMIGNIEDKRLTLKNAKKEIIAALRTENPQTKSLRGELRKKQRALDGLRKGVAHNPTLQEKIDQIESEISSIQEQLDTLGRNPITSRYTDLSPEERQQMLDQETEIMEALSEKDPSAIFIYLIMETIGEEKLTENDVNLIKEIASHLEGPFQLVSDLAKLDEEGRRTKQEKRVRVRMLDKRDDLMTMVRFADSKICCFSSNNYTMQVAHGTENKRWLSAINKDPLSFVFSIESADSEKRDAQATVRDNLGFVFGMYGVSDRGLPVVMLNGVYISTGNDATSAQSILNAIEAMLSRPLHAEYQLVSTKYGGGVSGTLEGYANTVVEAKRLRAIDSGRGRPETKIYDDLGTSVNSQSTYSGDAYHKQLT